ncbi:MAG: hypothetical protein M1822_003574 [Bathelium mastoideum]|nr:MAG: hypothetical protein M1822_003574 [Bathelium mastoideum]
MADPALTPNPTSALPPNGAGPSSPTPSAAPRGLKRARHDDDNDNTNSSHQHSPSPFLPSHAAPTAAAPPFRAADHAADGKTHLLLAATGSVAAIKLPAILRRLGSAHAERLAVRVVLTRAATRFLAGQDAAGEQPHWASLRDCPGVQAVYTDEDEWRLPWSRGAPILHIELRRWADLLVVAPLSADALGKVVGGRCDDLLSEVMRAWDVDARIDGPPRFGRAVENGVGQGEGGKMEGRPGEVAGKGSALAGDLMSSRYATPCHVAAAQLVRSKEPVYKRKKVILVAPAMNTAMWRHPVTKTQMRVLEQEWNVSRDGWFEVLRPQEKALACGDTGDGAMMEWTKIVTIIEDRLGLEKGKGKEEGAERDAKRARN